MKTIRLILYLIVELFNKINKTINKKHIINNLFLSNSYNSFNKNVA